MNEIDELSKSLTLDENSNGKYQSHLLLVSLLENFCEMYDKNPVYNKKLFYVICQQLSRLGIIKGTDFMDETSTVRSAYKKVFKSLVINAINSVNTSNKRLLTGPEVDIEWDEEAKKEEIHRKLITDNRPTSRYHEDFIEIRLIGKGGFGSVYEVKNCLDQKHYAIKKIKIKNIHESELKIVREVKALANLDHVNVVRYNGAWIELSSLIENPEFALTPDSLQSPFITSFDDDDDDETTENYIESISESSSSSQSQKTSKSQEKSYFDIKTKSSSEFSSTQQSESITNSRPTKSGFYPYMTMYIQMELCQKNLSQWINERNSKNLPPDPIENIRIFRHIVEGVRYIHENGLIHRDLKPQNIFFSGSTMFPKIGDFGLVAEIEAFKDSLPQESSDSLNSSGKHTSGIGTVSYAAPEQLENEQYNQKADIYSLGVILFELFFVWTTSMEKAITFKDLRTGKLPPKFVKDWPKEASFILWLTSSDPCERPTTQEILEFQLIKGIDEEVIPVLERKVFEKDKLLEEKDKQIKEKDRILKEKDEEIVKLLQKISELSLTKNN